MLDQDLTGAAHQQRSVVAVAGGPWRKPQAAGNGGHFGTGAEVEFGAGGVMAVMGVSGNKAQR